MIRDEYRERNAFAFKIGEGSFEAVRTKLGELWPQITALLDELGCENFSLWQIGNTYFERADGYADLLRVLIAKQAKLQFWAE